MACVRKITEGRYRVDWRDDRGRRYRKFFKTLKKATSKLTDVNQKLETGTFISPKDTPTFAQMAHEWLEGKKANGKRPSTLEGWRVHLDNHLCDPDHGIGHHRLNKIDVGVIERFARGRKESGLAPQTVNKLLTTATAIFKFAVRHKKVITNTAELAERFSVGATELAEGREGERTGQEVAETEVLSPEELKRLLRAATAGLPRTLLQTVGVTGIRHGEALGLMWSDINFDTGKLSIRRTLSFAKVEKADRRQPRFTPPKTKTSRRTIDLPPEVVHALKVWKLQCPKGELQLVFPAADGQPAHRKNVLKHVLYPTLVRAGIARRIDMHGLRHSFASILIMRGEPVTHVANLLGHSSPAVTMKVYAHWFKDVSTDAVNDLAREMFAESSAAASVEGR